MQKADMDRDSKTFWQEIRRRGGIPRKKSFQVFKDENRREMETGEELAKGFMKLLEWLFKTN